jgi:hypothetical protein
MRSVRAVPVASYVRSCQHQVEGMRYFCCLGREKGWSFLFCASGRKVMASRLLLTTYVPEVGPIAGKGV